MIWALRWSVALRTFYRQILSLLYSSFPFGNFRPRLVRALLVTPAAIDLRRNVILKHAPNTNTHEMPGNISTGIHSCCSVHSKGTSRSARKAHASKTAWKATGLGPSSKFCLHLLDTHVEPSSLLTFDRSRPNQNEVEAFGSIRLICACFVG